jgi:cilia- and flagella-associated protein 52
VWHIHTGRELLRINVPNVGCGCVAFSADGSAILSGWSDGKIRAFGPQSGRLLYTIDAHLKAVKAVAATHDPHRIITGGQDGMVRIWEVGSSYCPHMVPCCLALHHASLESAHFVKIWNVPFAK